MEVELEALKKYIGGSGLAAYLYSQFVKGDVPSLNPLRLQSGGLL